MVFYENGYSIKNNTNYQYSLENSCLIKTYNVTENTVETFLTKEIQERYNITWTKTKLPTIHPSILVWLCKYVNNQKWMK